MDPLTGEVLAELDEITIFPASHYVTPRTRCCGPSTPSRSSWPSAWPSSSRESKLLEAQRLRMRTNYDLEMLREVGFCSGIENYSRHLDGRARRAPRRTRCSTTSRTTGSCVIDESHVTVPQLHGMYEGDMSRKGTLVEFGFRLPVGHGQPAAAVRRVHRTRPAGRLHVRHAGALRAARVARRWPSRSSGPPA